jgi:hypothetical protein
MFFKFLPEPAVLKMETVFCGRCSKLIRILSSSNSDEIGTTTLAFEQATDP